MPIFSNFGVFASPERELLLHLNDFDETLPGPFEYDVARLAASVTIAGRNNRFRKQDVRAATLDRGSTRTAMAMADFAQMGLMDIYDSERRTKSCWPMLRNAVADQEAKARGKKQSTKRAKKVGTSRPSCSPSQVTPEQRV